MRSVAGVALIAPARGRASKKIINIMHTGAGRCFWKPKWPWVKTKPPKPPKPSTTGRAVCNARFLLREVHVSGCAIRCVHRKGAPDRKPTPNAETWESRSALATRHRRRPCRLFPRPPPRGLKIIVGSFGIPGATPPGYEPGAHTGLDKAPPRTRDEGRLDARTTSHWSRIATQPRSCLPGAVTSA